MNWLTEQRYYQKTECGTYSVSKDKPVFNLWTKSTTADACFPYAKHLGMFQSMEDAKKAAEALCQTKP